MSGSGVHVMECMCAQTKPQFILSSETLSTQCYMHSAGRTAPGSTVVAGPATSQTGVHRQGQ